MLAPRTDGVVTIRALVAADTERLIAGRDDVSRQWLGPGSDDPRPTACIVVDNVVVGWVDYDTERAWLAPGEVNIGYQVFAPHRGNRYASRAVELLLRHLADDTEFHTGTLCIHSDNTASLAVAARAGFTAAGDVDGSRFFRRRASAGAGETEVD